MLYRLRPQLSHYGHNCDVPNCSILLPYVISGDLMSDYLMSILSSSNIPLNIQAYITLQPNSWKNCYIIHRILCKEKMKNYETHQNENPSEAFPSDVHLLRRSSLFITLYCSLWKYWPTQKLPANSWKNTEKKIQNMSE